MPELPSDKAKRHPWTVKGTSCLRASVPSCLAPYAELQATTNFSFLRGASHPDELVDRAADLGLHAIAVTDRATLAGIVRAHVAAKQAGTRLVVGCRLELSLGAPERRTAEDAEIAETRDGVLTTDEHRCTRIRSPLSDSDSVNSAVNLSDSASVSEPNPPSAPSASTSVTSAYSDSAYSDAVSVLVYPTDRPAYARLCRLLTRGKRRAPKGECHLWIHDLVELHEGLLAVVVPPEASPGIPAPVTDRFVEALEGLARVFDDDRISLAANRLYAPDDDARLDQLAALSAHTGVPLVATNDVHYHVPERRALQDVVTCIRHGTTIDRAGSRLFPNAERHLKPPDEMARLFGAIPEAVERTVEIADRARFDLDELRYRYPTEVCPPGMTPDDYLCHLVWHGARERFGQSREYAEAAEDNAEIAETSLDPEPYGLLTTDEHRCTQIRSPLSDSAPSAYSDSGSASDSEPNPSSAPSVSPSATSAYSDLPPSITDRLEHELALIAELGYATYFLTVHDIVAFARARAILCQGRGAAANSAVCYVLGITSVDPRRVDMLFERFVSRERDEPPDIDIDFEHERREEVIQHIYARYGRHRAALTAEVISYRGRSAVREVGKALGLGLDAVDRLARQLDWWDKGVVHPDRVRELGLDPDDPTLRMTLALTEEILGFPRHLSQHVGGFVITEDPLEEMVPIENAAMEDRTVIEWDKDDIDAMGMLKVDCLGLGMLTCIRKALEFVNGRRHRGTEAQRHRGWNGEARWTQIANRRELDDGTPGSSEGRDSNVQGSQGMAMRDGPRSADVCRDEEDAGGRTVRTDEPDASGGGLDPLEYRRGLREAASRRLHEVPSRRAGLARRAGDAIRADNVDVAAHGINDGRGSSPRRGPNAPIAHHEARGNGVAKPSVPLCLCASVPPPLQLHTIPPEDPAVYDMICNADTVGVFQIESRAQMSMLPRLRPRCYYDLVIEVAIVRPGPIQGRMVHPYLRRRTGEEPVTYPSPEVKGVLERTLGVPLFQEQAMQLAVVAAGFTPGEADALRRAMATWKRKGDAIGAFEHKFIRGMLERGYERDFADRCFEQIRGFGLYGFPESHAASFALLVYVSAWLKRHHPAAFAAALINSQPMGFYAPAQIVRDAREHGVDVRPVDVNHSGWDCRLEENDEATERRSGGERDEEIKRRRDEVAAIPARSATPNPRTSSLRLSVSPSPPNPALHLGMRLVRGLPEADARAIAHAVDRHGPFAEIESLWRASGASARALKALASADAFRSMNIDRRHALWEVRALRDEELPLFSDASETEENKQPRNKQPPSPPPSLRASVPSCLSVPLPPTPPSLAVAHDYAAVGLSLKAHPMAFFRDDLGARGVIPAADLRDERRCPHNRHVGVAGVVLMRQRPGTASGIVFMTLEDETGIANLVIRPRIYARYRKAARHAVCLIARGHVERQGEVVHVIVHRVEDMHDGDAPIRARSRDFH